MSENGLFKQAWELAASLKKLYHTSEEVISNCNGATVCCSITGLPKWCSVSVLGKINFIDMRNRATVCTPISNTHSAFQQAHREYKFGPY